MLMQYKFFLSFFFLFSFFFLGGIAHNSFAVTSPDECGGTDLAGWEIINGVCVPTDTGLSKGADPENPIWSVLDTFLKWILSIFGLIAIIAFVVSGIMYLTSGGNENQIDSAKRYMIWSIVGVVVALSGLIVIYAVDTWLNGYYDF